MAVVDSDQWLTDNIIYNVLIESRIDNDSEHTETQDSADRRNKRWQSNVLQIEQISCPTDTHTHTHMHVHTCTHARTHISAHTHTHTHKHTHTHTHIQHTHTHTHFLLSGALLTFTDPVQTLSLHFVFVSQGHGVGTARWGR